MVLCYNRFALTPRTFSELLTDSLLLLKESCLEWIAIVALGLLAGLAVTTTALLALGLTDMTLLMNALAESSDRVVYPLLAAGIFDKICYALAMIALLRAAAARDEGHSLGVRRAYSQALPRLLPFLWAQIRAFLSILWGLLRLIWPGLKLCVLYSFVPLTCVLEDLRGEEALRRSAAVAGVDPGKTLGNLAGASALSCAAYAGLAFIMTAAMTLPRAAIGGGDSLPEAMLLGFVTKLAGGLTLGWFGAFAVLLYRDLAAGSVTHPGQRA